MKRRIVWQKFIDDSEDRNASIFRIEVKLSKRASNVGKRLSDYLASHPRKEYFL
jgi:hypothetical protein